MSEGFVWSKKHFGPILFWLEILPKIVDGTQDLFFSFPLPKFCVLEFGNYLFGLKIDGVIAENYSWEKCCIPED